LFPFVVCFVWFGLLLAFRREQIASGAEPSTDRPGLLDHRFGFYLFIVIWPSLAGFVALHNRCQPLSRVARVGGTPARPDVYIRSKACSIESASHTRFEENVARSTPRRRAVEAKTKKVGVDPFGLEQEQRHRREEKRGKNGKLILPGANL